MPGSERPVGHAFRRGYRRRSHFLTPDQLQLVEQMRTVLCEPGGHVLLSGPGGTGKSTLLERMVEEFRAKDVWVIRFRTPPSSFKSLTTALFSRIEPGIHVPDGAGRDAEALLTALRDCQTCRQLVIIVDEAQAAPDDVLSGLFYIAGRSDDSPSAPVALLLAGTDGIGNRLARLLDAPVARLVRMAVPLKPLEPDEVGAYIRHQLAAADVDAAGIFPIEVIAQIAKLCGGVQSEISSLCGLAIGAAEHEGSRQVTPEILHRVWWDAWIAPVEREVEGILKAQPQQAQPISPHIEEELVLNTRGTSIEPDVDAFLSPESDQSAPLSAQIVQEELKDTWIAQMERDAEANSALTSPAEGAAEVRDAEAIPSGDESDSTDRGESVVRARWMSVRGLVERARSSPSRLTAWAIVAVALLMGSISYALRDNAQIRAHGENVQLAGLTEPSTGAQQPDQPTGGSIPEPTPTNATAQPAERMDGDAARPPESHRGNSTDVASGVLVGQPTLVSSGSEGIGDPLQSLPPTAAGLPAQSADRAQAVTGGDDVGASLGQMNEQTGEQADASPDRVLSAPFGVDAGTSPLVASMLKRAQLHLAADRLLSPKFNNAFFAYAEVLRLDPSNRDAKQGLESIKARLMAHSQTAQANGDLVGARRALEKVLIVDASDRRATAQLDQLDHGDQRALATP